MKNMIKDSKAVEKKKWAKGKSITVTISPKEIQEHIRAAARSGSGSGACPYFGRALPPDRGHTGFSDNNFDILH